MHAFDFGWIEWLIFRPNGLRNDAATFLEETKPTFLRFPGGNNMYVLDLFVLVRAVANMLQ